MASESGKQRICFFAIVALSSLYSPVVQSCSIGQIPLQENPSLHIFVGTIVSQITSSHRGHPAYGIEVEPLLEFTQEDLRLNRNYELYPSALDGGCNPVYMHSKPHMDREYEAGQRVAVFGRRVELPGLGDLGMLAGISGGIFRIHESCDIADLTILPSDESTGLPRCRPWPFQLRRALAALRTASSVEIEQLLLWLSDRITPMDYESIVRKYAPPDEVDRYLERRYGDILNVDCGTLQDVLANSGKHGSKYNYGYQIKMEEYCGG